MLTSMYLPWGNKTSYSDATTVNIQLAYTLNIILVKVGQVIGQHQSKSVDIGKKMFDSVLLIPKTHLNNFNQLFV